MVRLGKTKQYHNLNALIDRYSPDLKIIGVPCNQFGQQEPGKNLEEILNGIKHVRPGGGFVPKFELTKKMNVNGEKENKFYTFLKSHFPPTNDVAWNFEKFLIDKQGRVRYRMEDSVLPDDEDVTEHIEQLKREDDD
ncbi:glutathione peroxidase 3-like [Lineus longissimus]|uniref:glutathione peroxidase 3-like n=1 Tax=Lineus longissimus TaxID=88925 RepID=UPI00315DD4C8